MAHFFSHGKYTKNFWQSVFRRAVRILPRDSYLQILLEYFIWSEHPIRRAALRLSSERILELSKIDPWLHNLVLSDREMYEGREVLLSKPWNIALPIADLCNARCNFCTSWLNNGKVMKVQDLEYYKDILPFAKEVGLQGLGEPLANPHFTELMGSILALTDSRTTFYLITNAIFVKRHLDSLEQAPINRFNISLNAASGPVHEKVMGLGVNGFDTAIEGVKELIRIRSQSRGSRWVNISMVLTADNFHEVPAFVQLGNSLGVDQIILRTLMPVDNYPQGLNYQLLPPILLDDYEELKEQALISIRDSKVQIVGNLDSWDVDPRPKGIPFESIKLVTREDAIKNRDSTKYQRDQMESFRGRKIEDNVDSLVVESPYSRKAPMLCDFPYQQFVSTQLNSRLVPCCYITQVPKHEPIVITTQLGDSWNSEAMQYLRKSLKNGPLLDECGKCPLARNAIKIK